jgi:hypothetical protein
MLENDRIVQEIEPGQIVFHLWVKLRRVHESSVGAQGFIVFFDFFTTGLFPMIFQEGEGSVVLTSARASKVHFHSCGDSIFPINKDIL